MTFEQATKDYLHELKNQNVIIEAYITRVEEEFEASTCVGRFLEETGLVKEKQMIVYKEGETMVWKLLETIAS